MRSRARMWAAALAVAGTLGTAGAARADTITVTTHGDPSGADVACPGPNCSLRQAIATDSTGATIVFAEPGTYTVTQGAPIVIPFNVTVDGGGVVTVDGRQNTGAAGTYRLFTVNSGVTATLRNLTLTGSHTVVDHSGGDTRNEEGGGALYVPPGATAAVDHVEFAGDFAFLGGAVSSAGTLTVADSWFHDDDGALGGGLAVKGGTASVDRTTFQDEQGDAGAVFIYGGARVSVTDSTVYGSGQSNSRGGGIDNEAGTLALTRDTLAGNLRGSLLTETGGTTSAQATIVADGFSDGDTDCVAAGLPTADGTSAKAITTDLGDNLDQDGSCGLNPDNGGHPQVDPQLAPPAANGGFAPTLALLHGSAAIDGAGACSGADERGVTRPDGQACDIGAFEARRTGAPVSAATATATAVTWSSATLHAMVGLPAGEAGGAHFEWGTAPDALTHTSPVGAAGTGGPVAVELDGLDPNTTYYVRAVADDASGSLEAPGDPVSFTTAAAPPTVSIDSSAATDTTATIHFTIDPGGAHTTYVVKYGTDVPTQSTAPADVPSDSGPQQLSATLTGLTPGTTYFYDVVATNGSGEGDQTGELATDGQVAGVAGTAVTVTDSGDFGVCPHPSVTWGDGTAPTTPTVTCQDDGQDGQSFELAATHAYSAPGHYRVVIDYGEAGQTVQWAVISAPQPATPTPTPTATPSATPSPTPTATPTATPTPVFHKDVVVRPVSGTVLVRRKGSKTFVPLDAKAGVPLGSQVDVTHGRIALTSVPRPGGKPQTAQFYAGIFTVTQPGSVTQLTLSGPKPTCPARGAAAAAAKKKKVRSRQLWGDGHGSFRTAGQYSAATVRGTQWLVQDTCAGTLTRVAHGLVAVSDHVRHTTVLVRGGTSYLARPRRR